MMGNRAEAVIMASRLVLEDIPELAPIPVPMDLGVVA